jgi:hypothetical protein
VLTVNRLRIGVCLLLSLLHLLRVQCMFVALPTQLPWTDDNDDR